MKYAFGLLMFFLIVGYIRTWPSKLDIDEWWEAED